MSRSADAGWRPDPSWRQDSASNVKPGWVLHYDGADRIVRGVKRHSLEAHETEHRVTIWFDGITARGDEGQTVYVVRPEETS